MQFSERRLQIFIRGDMGAQNVILRLNSYHNGGILSPKLCILQETFWTRKFSEKTKIYKGGIDPALAIMLLVSNTVLYCYTLKDYSLTNKYKNFKNKYNKLTGIQTAKSSHNN